MKNKNDNTFKPEDIVIPEDEIWTYQVEGLKAPQIGVPVKNGMQKKIAVVIILVIAVSLSIFFSIRAVHSDTYEYTQTQDGWEFSKFNNTGEITSVIIDYAEGDKSKPITSVREYAFNCDEKVTEIHIGKDVKTIDAKSFYSCWALQKINVDAENTSYRSVDGVLYDFDMTQVICYPIDRDAYLREKAGYKEEIYPDNEAYDEKYVSAVKTYEIPDTVKVIGALAFNYADLAVVKLPDGLERIETMAFFRCTSLKDISLPDTLEYIGSDAFSYDQALDYMFIPEKVTFIGHHAFWDCVYKENGELRGITQMNIALSEDAFSEKTEVGDHWLPQYDYKLFKKNVDLVYSAQRQS